MYIFQLMGGLGNQMFEYAAARALENATNVPVKFDFDSPYPHIKYTYNLGVFNLDAAIATSKDLWSAKPKRKIIKRLFILTGRNPNCKLVKEKKDFQFDPAFFSIQDGSYISGFWQTELYFKSIEKNIREHFSFRIPPAGKNIAMHEDILTNSAVSLHIRRGDYVNVPSTNNFHGVCSSEYYKQAIEHMITNVPNAVFYIFSDDMAWVKEQFDIKAPHIYVDFNDANTNYEDMRLMSICKHHIIANSSFSWWGAWLNPDPGKIVIAPKRWMKQEDFDTRDLIPANWIRL